MVRPAGDVGGPVTPGADRVQADAIFCPLAVALGPREASWNAVSGVPLGCPTLERAGVVVCISNVHVLLR